MCSGKVKQICSSLAQKMKEREMKLNRWDPGSHCTYRNSAIDDK